MRGRSNRELPAPRQGLACRVARGGVSRSRAHWPVFPGPRVSGIRLAKAGDRDPPPSCPPGCASDRPPRCNDRDLRLHRKRSVQERSPTFRQRPRLRDRRRLRGGLDRGHLLRVQLPRHAGQHGGPGADPVRARLDPRRSELPQVELRVPERGPASLHRQPVRALRQPGLPSARTARWMHARRRRGRRLTRHRTIAADLVTTPYCVQVAAPVSAAGD